VYDEIEPGAMWQDSKVGYDLALKHREAWVRSALVSDIGWLVQSARLFAWMIPGEARVFGVGQLAEAKAWVAG
jgi:hypothetical protein